MLLTDYLQSSYDRTWDIALQCGIRHAVIRLPEDAAFDVTDRGHWNTVCQRFTDYGLTPVVVEPMPNALHEHIKTGDGKRDASIEKVIKMFPILRDLGIKTICFNWMAHTGWLRTKTDYPDRGGATVTAFDLSDIPPLNARISEQQLWDNYSYFIKAVIPKAEKYGICLALHPDDPPVPRIGNVSRIMCSAANIRKAIFEICPSSSLGITLCQANFYLMGENLRDIADTFDRNIFFIHFRNVSGTAEHFHETFHDNGDIPMADILKYYIEKKVDVPIRVDHVPTLREESASLAGYGTLGRLYAIGYLKGILETCNLKSSGGNTSCK